MRTTLTNEVGARIASIIKKTDRRAAKMRRAEERRRVDQKNASRRFRLAHNCDRAWTRYRSEMRLNKALAGLKAVIEFACLSSVRKLLAYRGGEIQFYRVTSSRPDAPDEVGICFTKEGISLRSGCIAANDYGEEQLFPYHASDEELRKLLERFIEIQPNPEAYLLLDRDHTPRWEWGWPASEIGFEVFVDCSIPERLERYVKNALTLFARSKAA